MKRSCAGKVGNRKLLEEKRQKELGKMKEQ
jgi:hypothetical protein